MKTLRARLFFALALSLGAALAAPPARADATNPTPSPQTAAVITITTNTQITLDDLRIAAFNVRDEAYKDDKGNDAKGLTAALQISVRDDATKDQKLRVHAGQTISAGGKTFDVVAVDKSGVKLRVR